MIRQELKLAELYRVLTESTPALKEPKCINIPSGKVLERMNELDTSTDIVVVCRFGLQSLKVIRLLREHGFTKLHHLEGGINRWAIDIDPSLPVY